MKILVNTVLLLLLCSSVAATQVLTVNTRHDVVDPEDGLLSLREAIDSAKAIAGPNEIGFDAMFADPDSLILLDSTLVIDDSDGLVIDGAGTTTVTVNPELDGLRFNGMVIRSGNFTVRHLAFTDIRGVTIVVDTSLTAPVSIGPGNAIRNSEENAVWVIRSQDVTITQNTILEAGWWGYNDGILVTDSSSNIIITGNVILYSYASGIASFQSGPLTISGNYVGRNLNNGISTVEGPGGHAITGNIVVGNNVDGIYVGGGENSQIIGNSVGDSVAVTQVPTLAAVLADLELPPLRPPRTDVKAPSARTQPQSFVRPLRPERRTLPGLRAVPPPPPPPVPTASAATTDHAGNGGNGISIHGTSNTVIEDNLIYGSDWIGIAVDLDWQNDIEPIYPSDLLIQRNRIERSGQAQIWFFETGPLTIHNNTLVFSGDGIVGGTYYGGARAAPYSVTQTTEPVAPASIVSITENFITNVEYGHAVYITDVDSAYVARNRVINQYSGIFLNACTRAVAEWNEVSNVQEYAFDSQTSGKIWIQDNIFDNAGYGIYTEGNYEGLGDAFIARNRVTAVSYSRIQAYGLREAVIDDNIVTGASTYAGINVGYSETMSAARNNGPSLYVYEVDSVVLAENTIRGQYDESSIYVHTAGTVQVRDNSISDGVGGTTFAQIDSLWVWNNEILQSRGKGIYLYEVLFAHLWENDVYGHHDNGIYFEYVDSAAVERNNVTGNQSTGVYSNYGGGILLKNNTILENLGAGVYSYEDTVIAIDDNFIALNGRGFEIWDTTPESRVTGNTFFRNLDESSFSGAIEFLNAEGNYWGNESGPRDLADSDGLGLTNNGSGDHVSEQIDWDPFLQAPAFLSEARPAIDEVTPGESPRAGGGNAVLKGRQFLPGMTLRIGDEDVDVEYVTSDLVTFVIPPGPGGPVHVVATNANGKVDTLFKGFRYENNSPFPFSLVSPASESTISSAPQFVWRAALDPDGDALEYIVEYAPVSTFEGSVRTDPVADTTLWLSAGALNPSTTYYWRVIATDGREGIASSPVSTFETDVILSAEETEALPQTFAMEQNYPNPFNPETVIRFQLPTSAAVSLRVFDLLGREVATLVNEMKPAGFHTVTWNGRNSYRRQVASGVYFFRIEAGSFVETRRMVLVR